MTKKLWSYVENNLMPSETIIKKAEVHWSIYIPAIALTIIFAPVFLFLVVSAIVGGAQLSDFLSVMSVVMLFVGLPWAVAYMAKVSTELAVTNKRVIAKKGIISRKTVELNLSKVESLTVNQGLLGRLLNSGTLIVNGTGGVKTPFKAIDDPLSFRKAVNEQIEGHAV